MRHGVKGNQFARPTNQAKALYRSLVSEVIDHGRVQTTLAKAKAVVGMVDKVINIAKTDTVNNRRGLIKMLGTDKMGEKLFSEVAPRFGDRTSGYSRIIRTGQRFSDTAEMAILELVNVTDIESLPKQVSETVVEKENKKEEIKGKKEIASEKKEKSKAGKVKKTSKK